MDDKQRDIEIPAAQSKKRRMKQWQVIVIVLAAFIIVTACAVFAILWGVVDQFSQPAVSSTVEPDTRRETLLTAEVGDIITLGRYEQDNVGENGAEEIEWIVLEKENNRLLIISRYALELQPYHETGEADDTITYSWAESLLRWWLNVPFYNTSFDEAERDLILGTPVSADNNPTYGTAAGNATLDNIFLLSIDEARKYFPTDEERQCKLTPYAATHKGTMPDLEGNITWWLRSPGAHTYQAAFVRYDGSIADFGTWLPTLDAVRPVMWLDLSEPKPEELTESGESSETVSIVLPPDSMPGNTVGNLANGGIAAIEGDWIYYLNGSDDRTLYAVKTDGSGKRKLSDDIPSHISVMGDRIYYLNISDNYQLYTVKMDGSERKKLSDDSMEAYYIIDDRIFYCNSSDGSKIYTVMVDGSDRQRLNDVYSADLNIAGGRIYYTSDQKLYTMNIDGSEPDQLSDEPVGFVNVVGDRIYYTKLRDHFVYSMRIDGSDEQCCNEQASYDINLSGDWIYYSNGDDGYRIYAMKTDGSEQHRVNDDAYSTQICVVGDRIYYHSTGFYSIKTDGTDRRPVD